MSTKTTKILALMAALSLGSAHAATTAGTKIDNTATAAFDDPAGGNTGLTVTSNTVSTLVTPVTGFDIIYSDNSADDTSATTPAGTYDKKDILPGGTVVTKYRVVNNGNIDNYAVNLSSNTTGSANAPTSVQYFADDNDDGEADNATALTSVTLANGGEKKIVQVITLPTNAARGAQYSASPQGTAPAGNLTSNGTTLSYTVYNESSNQNGGVAPTNGDRQYTRATVYSPAGLVGPSNNAPGAVAGDGTYNDPNNNAVSITKAGDAQTATVPSGTTTTTFLNTLRNDGDLTDSFRLSATKPAGADYTVTFKTPNGTAITGTVGSPTVDGGVSYYVDGGNVFVKDVPKNGTASFQTVVTYSATTAGAQNFVVSIESVKDFDTTAEDTTTNTVNVPGLLFGDRVGTGNAATPTPLNNPNPAVNPGTNATFPMAIKNMGGAADTFNVSSAQVQFQVVNQTTGAVTTQGVSVSYAPDDDCDGVASETGEALPLSLAANATGCVVATVAVPSNALKGTTPQFTQTATGVTSTRTAEDTNDTITVNLIKDTTLGNNGVQIAKFTNSTGVTAGSKPRDGIANPADYTTDSTTAAPNANITYKIIAKNVWNTGVTKFYLADTVPANTTLQSIALTGVTAANTIYQTSSNGGTTWSSWTKLSTAPTVVAAGTMYRVAVDASPSDNAPDALGPSSTLELTLVVKVN